MPIEALEGISDRELFDGANSDEASTEEVSQSQEETTEQKPEDQPPAAEQAAELTAAPASDPPANTTQEQPRGERIPLAEYLSEREKRQAFENDLKAEREKRLDLERRLAEQSKPKQEPEKVSKPDPLLDPDGYETYIEKKVEEKLLNDRREASLQNAHKTYKSEFEEAYAAAQKNIDPVLKARMQSSRDPGETLIEWHREQKTRAEVGSDLTAYKQRLREEAMKDPEFRKLAMEAWRTEAQQPTGGKAPPVSLPPSLTRATNASGEASADDNDVSDEGLWRHANA